MTAECGKMKNLVVQTWYPIMGVADEEFVGKTVASVTVLDSQKRGDWKQPLHSPKIVGRRRLTVFQSPRQSQNQKTQENISMNVQLRTEPAPLAA